MHIQNVSYIKQLLTNESGRASFEMNFVLDRSVPFTKIQIVKNYHVILYDDD